MSVSPSNSRAHLRCAAADRAMGGRSVASSKRPASIVACSRWLLGLSNTLCPTPSSPLCSASHIPLGGYCRSPKLQAARFGPWVSALIDYASHNVSKAGEQTATICLTCDLRLKVSCIDLPAERSCCCCSGRQVLEALQDTEPTPGPAAGSTLLTSSQALGRSNRNLTYSNKDVTACKYLQQQLPRRRACPDPGALTVCHLKFGEKLMMLITSSSNFTQ